jgi:cation/acetate symporter
LPRWITLWQPAGLFEVVDKNGDGIVQWADFVVKSTDFVVLSMPEVAGLPFVITVWSWPAAWRRRSPPPTAYC